MLTANLRRHAGVLMCSTKLQLTSWQRLAAMP
jgi:hypothetical protein